VIAVDWGTSSFRAYRLDADGGILDRRSAPLGIMQIEDARFAKALESQVGDWLAAGEAQVVMSGMIGSRQGWLEVPYASCPARVDQIVAGVREVRWEGHRAWIAPGLSTRDPASVPDVMRGEETQIMGVLDQLPASAWICLPGTHSKWVEVRDGTVVRFSTHMTGEVFALLRAHSILGRMMSDAPTDPQWFAAGVRRAQDSGGLLHHLFGVRAQGLFGELPDEVSASYLSGILIGHELVAARSASSAVFLLGAKTLVEPYQHALRQFGREATVLDPDAVVHGLFQIGTRLSGGR
jgi:2-dehydro-3-deoxygalactonokinase